MKAINSSQAILSWRMNKYDRIRNYANMGDGYFKGATVLLNHFMDAPKDKDIDVVIFPILFSIHQGMELYLKAVIIAIEQLNEKKNQWLVELKKTHNLNQLIDELNAGLSVLQLNDKLVHTKETDSFFQCKTICESIGDNGFNSYFVDFARYPEHLSKKGVTEAQHAFVFDNNTLRINLAELLQITHDCNEFLDGYFSSFCMWLDEAKEEENAKA